jgi:hypothetical protein
MAKKPIMVTTMVCMSEPPFKVFSSHNSIASSPAASLYFKFTSQPHKMLHHILGLFFLIDVETNFVGSGPEQAETVFREK